MALKLYDTKDAVPESQRTAAVETKDGKFAVSEDDPALGEAGKRAIQEEREARQREERARKTAEKDLDDLKREQKARAAGISEEELQKIRADEALARKPIEDELAQTKAENRKLKLTDRVQALALKYGVMPDRIEDAMLLLDKRTDLTDKDGIAVKDREGKVTTETVDEFLKTTFKKEKPWLYAGSGASGSGASGSSGTGDPEPPKPDPAKADARNREIRSAF